MPTNYMFVGYPDARMYDKKGNQIKHLLWGDWVRIEDGAPPEQDMKATYCRGVHGFMHEGDLQEERLLEIVFVDVGQGDGCLVVTPDDKKLVIDAGIADNMFRFLRWRFDFRDHKRTFDAAIITHPDADHYAGFGPLFGAPNVRFRRVYHNGIIEASKKSRPLGAMATTGGRKYLTEIMETQGDLQSFLAQPQRYGKMRYPNLLKDAVQKATAGTDDVRMLAAPDAAGEAAYVPGFGPGGAMQMRVLGPVVERDSQGRARLRCFGPKPGSTAFDKGKTKNGHSVLIRAQYRDVSILLGGDLNTTAESFLLEHYSGLQITEGTDMDALVAAARPTLAADITKSCHHGSADFTDTFLEVNDSVATVVSSGDEESYAHPRSDTLGAIGRHGRGSRPLILSTELARSTREDEGETGQNMGRILQRLDDEQAKPKDQQDSDKISALRRQRAEHLEKLARRNVTVYGAINLRTDGHRVVLAYMLERERKSGSPEKGSQKITRWDMYKLEPVGNGPIGYVK